MSKTRSPLKASPLREPGQSVQEEIERVMDQDIMNGLLALGLTGMMLSTSLVAWVFRAPHELMAGAGALFFLLALAYAVPRLMKGMRRLRALNRSDASV